MDYVVCGLACAHFSHPFPSCLSLPSLPPLIGSGFTFTLPPTHPPHPHPSPSVPPPCPANSATSADTDGVRCGTDGPSPHGAAEKKRGVVEGGKEGVGAGGGGTPSRAVVVPFVGSRERSCCSYSSVRVGGERGMGCSRRGRGRRARGAGKPCFPWSVDGRHALGRRKSRWGGAGRRGRRRLCRHPPAVRRYARITACSRWLPSARCVLLSSVHTLFE